MTLSPDWHVLDVTATAHQMARLDASGGLELYTGIDGEGTSFPLTPAAVAALRARLGAMPFRYAVGQAVRYAGAEYTIETCEFHRSLISDRICYRLLPNGSPHEAWRLITAYEPDLEAVEEGK